jgi:flagellar FliJ protein
MKKFKFSMQSILNVNQTMKEVRQGELAEARYLLEQEEEKLKRIRMMTLEAMDPGKLKDNCSGAYLLQRERYIKKLKDDYKAQLYLVREAETKVEQAVKRLQEATVELRKMEKVKGREHENWNLEFRRDEQKINDEIGSTKAFFNKAATVY